MLVQKEWADLGHKFEDRLYSGTDEQSPVYLQFLDSVFQLTQQFPTVSLSRGLHPQPTLVLNWLLSSPRSSSFCMPCHSLKSYLHG